MNKKITILYMALGSFICSASTLYTDKAPVNLRCEHLCNPIGIDTKNPRLSWKTLSPAAEFKIIVGTDSISVANGVGKQWSTIIPDSVRLVSYQGEPLNPFTKYFWRIEQKDEKNGTDIVSNINSFETGMLDEGNWQGAWISDSHDKNFRPAPYFRKDFKLNKNIKTARAYVTAAGLFELYINGERIGDHRLDPLYTRFDKRNYYVTHNITSQLTKGDNAIGVILGNGWYNHQSTAVWNFHNAQWRNRPAFCLDLRITYDDGTVEVISSERDWKTSTGPLTSNSIYTAEHYNANLEQYGWASPGFDDSKWNGVGYRQAPSANITAQQAEPIRAVEKIAAKEMLQLNDSTYVFDFGVNIAGVTSLLINGKPGTVIKVIHGERLKPDGHVDLSNIDVYYRPTDNSDPFQTDIYTLKGQGEEKFEPKFNYKGFRYAEVIADDEIKLSPESLTAYFVHSDVKPVGYINTSNQLINNLWKATNRAYLSNLMGYPTDCPQREKNGWTGDGHFAIETALYNFDGITVYEKWLADHRDEQQPNGVLPDIIPTCGWGYGTDNGTDWTSTIAIIPWELYLFYGDIKPLADCYDNIRRYVDYIDRTYPSGLTTWGRGDWVPVSVPSNKELTSSVYFFTDATILSKVARLLGKDTDAEKYEALADKIKNAINHKYLDREQGIYASGTQTELSVPLKWGIVPQELKSKVAANLNQKVIEAGFHLDVGVLGAKALLDALTENGYATTAWKVASQDTYPSWGHWIANGATTLHENWDMNATRDISDNHMMFGEIGAWFYKGLAGIYPDPSSPGFRHIILRPNFPEELKTFEASFDSTYGPIMINWQHKSKKKVACQIIIPDGSKASLKAPEGMKITTGETSLELSSGQHNLTFIKK